MPYRLGLHIEDNYIRYAKVLIEKKQMPKLETYGIVFYDNLSLSIEQIIKETLSYDAEISINLNNEFYNYFEVFSGMKLSNLKEHLKLRFSEEVCVQKNINPSFIESRFIIKKAQFNEDEMQILYISANKSDIKNREQLVKGKVKRILPVSIANISLLDINEMTNIAILSIDSFSTLTIVLKGVVKEVYNINVGMDNILSKLNQKYNLYSKSYSQCKKLVFYDDKTKELINEENQSDINEVTPLLYDIAQRVKGMLKRL